ncbi:helix-turn-helix domain-containing protein [Streptomyces alkaliphilus]|uniref:Helix-turn-helix domain-containing protein n=1 Tax=Streptomyces alkaliphilus TaxID=1472722 RepID=A0A7W3Y036_9ACTN|nr:helix-turn-helix domain-containing protein [Streptomyces alkaliphilus]
MSFAGNRLREIRKARGFSQEQLAAELGVRPAYVSKWERGVSAPNGTNTVKLLRALGCELEEVSRCPAGRD